MASDIDDPDGELDAVLGQTLGAIGHDDNEWYMVFVDGTRLTLSSGYKPYFKVGNRPQ